MARFISVRLSTDLKDVVTIPCDQFDVNDDGSLSAYFNGELWGHFATGEYVYAHIVDEEILAELGLEEDDDEESGDEDEAAQYSLNGHVPIVVPDDASELEDADAPAAATEDDDASR